VSHLPRVVLLADRPDWAFSFVARALMARLSQRFCFRLIHRECEALDVPADEIDLLYVFWWGDRSYQHLGLPPERIIKEVASHRWAIEERFGQLSPQAFAAEYLADCARVTTPSVRLFETLRAVRSDVFHCPNGVDVARFRPGRPRRGPLRIGWVGNPRDTTKGLHEILKPAAARAFHFEHTDGRRSLDEVARLYQRIDVLAIASRAESQPLPLLEAMASGCFPVTTDVGVAPELIRSGCNGLLAERDISAFRDAFDWCAQHLDFVRRAGRFNAGLVAQERGWDRLADRFGALFDAALGRAPEIPARAPLQVGSARSALSRGVIPARVAFVTPEFVSEDAGGGGLGTYVGRMARALVEAGHAAEIFVPSARGPGRIECDGIPVHRVRRAVDSRIVQALLRTCRALGLRRLARPLLCGIEAARLARALRRREAQAPFDLVQSSEYLAVGSFVRGRRRGARRPHLVRCSNDGARIAAINRGSAAARSWLDGLERRCVRGADAAYAPSHFLARHYAAQHGIPLAVLRPPIFLEVEPAPEPPPDLPKRYFIHFGQLTRIKGTADLAAALPRVWAQAPDFAMVWAGVDRHAEFPAWSRDWGEHRDQVQRLEPLPKPLLYAVLSRAEAAVLPSRFDNLPNTVIESLLHGVPVIGTRGTSIEELVEPGVNGLLVAPGDVAALADAILRQWRGESGVRAGFQWSGTVRESTQPARAVAALLALAECGAP